MKKKIAFILLTFLINLCLCYSNNYPAENNYDYSFTIEDCTITFPAYCWKSIDDKSFYIKKNTEIIIDKKSKTFSWTLRLKKIMKNYFPGTSQFLPFMKRVPRKMTRRRLKIE